MRSIIIKGMWLYEVIDLFTEVNEANKAFYRDSDNQGRKGSIDVFAVDCKAEFDIGQAGSVLQKEKYTVTVSANPARNHCDSIRVYAKLAEFLRIETET